MSNDSLENLNPTLCVCVCVCKCVCVCVCVCEVCVRACVFMSVGAHLLSSELAALLLAYCKINVFLLFPRTSY